MSREWEQKQPDSRGGAKRAEETGVKHLDDITGAIVDAALKIHQELGPGLLESVYEAVLARALEKRGFTVERQKTIRFEYDGMVFEEGFRVDLLVEAKVVVELFEYPFPLTAAPRLRVSPVPEGGTAWTSPATPNTKTAAGNDSAIPVAMVELKTDFTQSIDDAIDQYRFDRLPHPARELHAPANGWPSPAEEN